MSAPVGPSSGSSASPDLVASRQLIELLDLDNWTGWTTTLSNAIPFLRIEAYDRLKLLQAWLAKRAADEPSRLTAAHANLRRIVDDLLWVFDYDFELRSDAYWVRKWYHRGLGGSGRPSEVEHYQLHVLLIQNLVSELVRGVNLILVRARVGDPDLVIGVGLVTVDTASDHAPYQPAQYSAAESASSEPYPGLRAFPAVISSRDYGALGEHAGDPRTPEMFVAWIDELAAHYGLDPSPAPPDYSDKLAALSRMPRPRQRRAKSFRACCTQDHWRTYIFPVLLTILFAGSAPWWWSWSKKSHTPPAITGFAGSCHPFIVYAQNRWKPYGTQLRPQPNPDATSVSTVQGNLQLRVNGWVHSRVPDPTNKAPWNSDVWFHLADGAGWVSFAGVRAVPTAEDPTGVADGGIPAPIPASCEGALN